MIDFSSLNYKIVSLLTCFVLSRYKPPIEFALWITERKESKHRIEPAPFLSFAVAFENTHPPIVVPLIQSAIRKTSLPAVLTSVTYFATQLTYAKTFACLTRFSMAQWERGRDPKQGKLIVFIRVCRQFTVSLLVNRETTQKARKSTRRRDSKEWFLLLPFVAHPALHKGHFLLSTLN